MSKIRVSEIRVSEIRGSKIRGSEIRGSKIRGSEIRVSEIRGSKIRGIKIRVSEIRISSNHRELHGAIFGLVFLNPVRTVGWLAISRRSLVQGPIVVQNCSNLSAFFPVCGQLPLLDHFFSACVLFAKMRVWCWLCWWPLCRRGWCLFRNASTFKHLLSFLDLRGERPCATVRAGLARKK